MADITIFLTSFNHEKFIGQAIESALNQTFQNFEILIWDDASTDNSWNIINSYRDKRIKAFRNKQNEGKLINKALLEGLIQSKYVAILHSDDYWVPTKLQNQKEFLDSNENIGAVFTLVDLVNESGISLSNQHEHFYNIMNQPNRTQAQWLRFFFRFGNALCHPSILIRKECFERIGLYNYALAQLPDFDMWIRLCIIYPIHILQQKLTHFRVLDNNKNSSGNTSLTRIRSSFEFNKILENYRTINNYEFFSSIFPEVVSYCTKDNFDVDYALARIILELTDNPAHLLFAQNLLYTKVIHTAGAKSLKETFDFSYKDFIKITGMNDLFGIECRISQNQLYLDKLSLKKLLENEKVRNNGLEKKIELIKNSMSWKITKPLRLIELYINKMIFKFRSFKA